MAIKKIEPAQAVYKTKTLLNLRNIALNQNQCTYVKLSVWNGAEVETAFAHSIIPINHSLLT